MDPSTVGGIVLILGSKYNFFSKSWIFGSAVITMQRQSKLSLSVAHMQGLRRDFSSLLTASMLDYSLGKLTRGKLPIEIAPRAFPLRGSWGISQFTRVHCCCGEAKCGPRHCTGEGCAVAVGSWAQLLLLLQSFAATQKQR